MKRIISLFACVVMIFAMATSVIAANNVSIDASATTVKVGDTVTLTVSVDGTENASSAFVGVEFTDCFELVSAEWLLTGGTPDYNTTNNEGIYFYMAPSNMNGEVFELTLEAVAEAEVEQDVNITVEYKNGSTQVLAETETVAIGVFKPAITGVKFAKAVYEYTYDGTEKAVEVTGLGNGMTVEYDGTNVATDAGEYEVTAVVTKEGYKDLELSATIVINPKTVEITGLKAEDKVYDTTTEALITGGELKGVIEGDDVDANFPVVGEFASANVGTRIAVTYEEIALSGDDAANYELKAQPALTAKITACPVTITTHAVKSSILEGQDEPENNYYYEVEPAFADDELDISVAREPGTAKKDYLINATYDKNNKNYTVTVIKGVFSIDDKYTQEVVIPTVGELVYGDEDFNVTVTPDPKSGIIDFTYESTNEDVVVVDVNGVVSIVGAGEASIIITSESNESYKALDEEIPIVVVPMTITEIADIYYDGDELVIEIEDGTKIPVDIANATVEVDENDEVTLSDIALLNGNFALDEDVEIPTFIAPAEKLITVEAEETENGFIEGTGKYLIGSTVTITPVASTGYKAKSVTVTDTLEGTEIVTAKTEDGEYTFIATVDATVTAEFAKKGTNSIISAPGSDKKPGTGTTAANKAASQIVLTIGSVEAQVYGETVANDVAPIIVNDRTMLPARFVAESLGAYVAWDNAQRKVTIHKNLTMIEIYIDSDIAYINGNPVTLDSPAFIQNDRTYTPIRFIAEALGATVEWNELLRQVTITRN